VLGQLLSLWEHFEANIVSCAHALWTRSRPGGDAESEGCHMCRGVSATAIWTDFRPRMVAQFQLTSWLRDRGQTLTFLTSEGPARVGYPLAELICQWENDAKKAVEHKPLESADLRMTLIN
jgi:hypothetical protein